MTPTLNVDKLHDGTPVLSEAGIALARAVSVGLRPMRLDVYSTAANVEELTDNLNGISHQLQTQGKMLELMAKSIHSLKTVTSSGLTEIKQKVGLDKGDKDAIKADLQAAKANQAELVRIRTRLRAYSKEETATTLLTRRVYLSADHYVDLMHMAIEDELVISEEDAQIYSMSRKIYPARKCHTAPAGKRKRQSAADWQTVADLMDKPTADNWLLNNSYIESDEGNPAMVETVEQFMLKVGASKRVVASKNVGGGEYVDCTVGHVSIVCAIILGELEKAAGIKPPRRNGLASGVYAEFAVEVPRQDDFLPMHDLPAGGLRLVDGGDEDRGKLDKDDYVETDELLQEEAIDMAAVEAGVVEAMEE
ncbi:hypothetical protein I4F81_006791 [Pyropia yezoensis]|uniref:Uncharacterized protein n=1 Tax=Pyropia yezoensis TaxID=2788 RepID=A0ACC3C1T5_PYRYE|nr:hypothetical protein I4F81_006791 [Neopyropia yezoensis]